MLGPATALWALAVSMPISIYSIRVLHSTYTYLSAHMQPTSIVGGGGVILYVPMCAAGLPAARLQARSWGVVPVLLGFACTGVYRGLKDTRLPLYASALGATANVLLNYTFLYGEPPGHGPWLVLHGSWRTSSSCTAT